MFKRFMQALRFRRADQLARELVVPLRRCLARFEDEDGEVASDIRDDDFVLTYIFGAVLGRIESTGKKAKPELFLRWLATKTALYKASTIEAKP